MKRYQLVEECDKVLKPIHQLGHSRLISGVTISALVVSIICILITSIVIIIIAILVIAIVIVAVIVLFITDASTAQAARAS